jgi:glutamate-ammonia-ligase adenylyltransferase
VTNVLGYSASGALLEDYRRHARHARGVVERIFYGVDDDDEAARPV